MDTIRVSTVPPQRVVSLRAQIGSFREQGALWAELHQFVAESGLARTGPALMVLHAAAAPVDVEVCVPVAADARVAVHDRIAARELPAQTVAALGLAGAMAGVAALYPRLRAWIADNGFAVCGPSREVYVRIPPPGCTDMSAYDDVEAEVQFPIREQDQ
ncbi:hypothetical protein BDR26DRAFT_898486 [Obelidium mucronatum]|nr:hypothetical protein BDR26DRAFT_898486 [Obelidium mucronatum]